MVDLRPRAGKPKIESFDRPLLCADEMVRAILHGLKTQTRREIGRLAGLGPVTEFQSSTTPGYDWIMRCRRRLWQDFRHAEVMKRCPYGEAGDRLWVREAWTPDHVAFYPCFPIVYRADFGQPYDRNERCEVYSSEQQAWYPFRWRPSIFMPRHYSRILLDILSVRIERLQDISEDDARAEGVKGFQNDDGSSRFVDPFRILWDKINGKGAWERNPMVWAITFKRSEVARG